MFPVAYPRKQDGLLDVVIATPYIHLRLGDGRLALLTATLKIITLHIFDGVSVRHDPVATVIVYRECYPSMFDGRAWNLSNLEAFVGELLAQVPHENGVNVNKHQRIRLYQKCQAYRNVTGKRPRRARREGIGEACLLLRCAAIKQIIPCMEGETVKFFLLAAAHGNEVATAWAQQDVYRGMGYHPEKIGRNFDALVEAGLMRWIRRNYFNPVTRRKEPNVYQFNPELCYVRRSLRSEAYGLSQQPFAEMARIGGENPDRKVRGKSDQPPVRESNQHQLTKTKNHHQRSTNGSKNEKNGYSSRDYENQHGVAGQSNGKKPDRNLRSNPDQAQSAQNSDAKSHTNAKRNASPPPTPSPRTAADFERPLSDPALESLAHRAKAECATRLWQARQLVDMHGVTAVEWGLEQLTEARRVGNVRSPFGLLKSWLDKNMHAAHGEAAGRDEWWMNQQAGAAGN